MLFPLSKILGFVATPSNFLALVGLAGVLALAMRHQNAAVGLLSASVIGFAVAGLSPLGNILLLTLSERFPAWQPNGRNPDGIIVLGGGIDPETSRARGGVELGASAERILEMLRVARRYPEARVVISGGSSNLIRASMPEAPVAGELLQEFGVAPERILVEADSRTTAENAERTRSIANPQPGQRWLLMTSAFHMPRSIGVFRKAGFDVEAYPVDWRTRGWNDALAPFDRLSDGLARTDLAMHEWTGLLAYWLSGKTSEFFPSPRVVGRAADAAILR